MASTQDPTCISGGLKVDGVETFGVGGMLPFGGNYFWVDETNGSDGNDGTAGSPLATLPAAKALMRSGYNDVCFFSGTVHLSASLAWDLDKAHLIGLCPPNKRGKRARLSPASTIAGTAGWNYLVNVTGQGCLFANFGTFYGFSNTAAALVAWYENGGRNAYQGVEILGFGDDTAVTGTANLTGARALKINGTNGECTFRDCVFGLDTKVRNVTNHTVEITGGAPRITFDNCDFEADLGSSGGGSSHVLIGAGGIDRYVKLKDCTYMNATLGGPAATAMAQVFNVNAAAGGAVIQRRCLAVGATALQTTPTANMVMDMTYATANGGLAHVVF